MGQALHPEMSLVALVFVLGLKHGLDPDHLVAIDGFVRTTKRDEMRRWCGLFFSLGHGLVVTLVGVAVAVAAAVALVGAGSPWLPERVARASHPAVIAAVGAAFAVSFDTVSHALVFSAGAGAAFAGVLGAVFTLGMASTDALNGWWISRLVSAADQHAAIASRIISVAI